MADPNPSRTARLAGSLEKAFGETFDIFPMVGINDVDARYRLDNSRDAILAVTGMWDGPADSKTPYARGASTDDVVHNWTTSFPSAIFSDVNLPWTPRKGDKLVRKLDNTTFQVIKPFPNGLGRTLLQLSSKAR
ncbi:MAG TPA: hypothetical protein VF491_19550 [Vicinamibacterales bacterium]